jgi:CheY-like chemotaxis protein
VRNVAEAARDRLRESRLDLVVELPRGSLWVDADPTRIVQVLDNLLTNSQKYTDPGGAVHVRAGCRDERAFVTVEDTGSGIDPAQQTSIFEPFYQAGRSRQQAAAGLGLGLPIVKGVIEGHGGRVGVRSAGRGTGSTFWFELPLQLPPLAVGRTPQTEPRARRRRVLLVDDHEDSVTALADLLRLEGQDVRVVGDGTSALEQAGGFRPDLVICDIGLPDMEGYDVARALRDMPIMRGATLIALSGYADEKAAARSRDAGFDVHLAKPLDPGVLRALLAEGAA